jgi:hypothetical protein
MGDWYKQVYLVFFTHEPSYEYFHVLTLSHVNPSFGALNNHVRMHDFICIGKMNTSYICCNNTQ